MDKKVLLVTMGGTIAGKVSAKNLVGENVKDSKEFASILADTIESIQRTAGINVKIAHEPLCDIDSSDIMPKQWSNLAQLIKDNYDDYDSFLVTHGTNTMGYTAAALSFALVNLNKPVIITGSQVPAGMPGSDAIMNLENALRIAVLNRKDGEQIRGVLAVFGSHIITGTRVKKSTEFDYDAFQSFGVSEIGRIGRIIDINAKNLKTHVDYLSTPSFPRAEYVSDLRCENEFDMRIASLTEFPGMDGKIFDTLVEQLDIKGFILRAFGAGDASTNLLPALGGLKEKKIPIVITTQAPNGNSNFQVNEPGQKIADGKLAIPAFDMSIESITAKLAWLLAKKGKKEITYEQLCEKMRTDTKGEVNVIWETKM